MEWLILDVLMTHLDDIRTASALSRVGKIAPPIPPRLVREERERRDTVERHVEVMGELHTLQRPIGFADMFLTERDYVVDDRTSIREWCRVEHEGEVMFSGFVHEDGAPDLLDLTEYIPVLRGIGFWGQGG